MTWRRPDQWHLVTDDGRYTVSRANVGEWAHYTAWRVADHRVLATGRALATDDAGRSEQVAACKLACEVDAERNRE